MELFLKEFFFSLFFTNSKTHENKESKPNRNDWNAFEPQFQGFQVIILSFFLTSSFSTGKASQKHQFDEEIFKLKNGKSLIV